jgi:formamidopyrimidine-DNA glycosylase
VLHIHLKMTGHLILKFPISNFQFLKKSQIPNFKYQENNFLQDKVNGYIRHAWLLKKGKSNLVLEFSDLRKFGKIRLLGERQLKSDKELNGLGVEPLSKGFTLKKFKEILDLKENWTIRDVLMEQSLIAGIGNIYASEILFEPGVSPKRKNKNLTVGEIKKIFESIKKTLKKAVELRGTSDSDYRDTSGAPGGFQKILKVYNREGKPCRRKGCKGIVKREKMKQRSAYYCDRCQK